MSYDSFLDHSLDAYNKSCSYILEDRQVLGIAKRFELGEDQEEILRFAKAVQEAFMQENN